jgi:hypothetical protein
MHQPVISIADAVCAQWLYQQVAVASTLLLGYAVHAHPCVLDVQRMCIASLVMTVLEMKVIFCIYDVHVTGVASVFMNTEDSSRAVYWTRPLA